MDDDGVDFGTARRNCAGVTMSVELVVCDGSRLRRFEALRGVARLAVPLGAVAVARMVPGSAADSGRCRCYCYCGPAVLVMTFARVAMVVDWKVARKRPC